MKTSNATATIAMFLISSAAACAAPLDGEDEAVDSTSDTEQALVTGYTTCSWGAIATSARCSCAYAESGAVGYTWQEAGGVGGDWSSKWGWRAKEMRVKAICPEGVVRTSAWRSDLPQVTCTDGSRAVPTACQVRIKR